MCRKDPQTGQWHYCPSKKRKPDSNSTSSAEPIRAPLAEGVVSHLTAAYSLDQQQVDAIHDREWGRANSGNSDDLPQAWDEWCRSQAHAALSTPDDAVAADAHNAYMAMVGRCPSPQDARAAMAMPEAARKARNAYRRQVAAAGALQGVSEDEAAERVAAYRAQYAADLEHLPLEKRPDPPPEWVTGFTTKDMMAVSTPRDPATLYAIYRAQSDPQAFGGPRSATYVSVDLETAGPPGKDGFNPAHGCIIEYGSVTFDQDGVEQRRVSTLIQPADEARGTYGTGAVAVHGITWDDVKDAPTWASTAPQVADDLRNGGFMLAQNDRFERGWLHEHLGRQNLDFDQYQPGVDTLRIAQQHFSSLPHHRLENICEHLGVSYTNGHRATHDAEAAGRAFFAMKERIHSSWESNPVYRDIPQPALLPATGSRVQRSREVALDDPWVTR